MEPPFGLCQGGAPDERFFILVGGQPFAHCSTQVFLPASKAAVSFDPLAQAEPTPNQGFMDYIYSVFAGCFVPDRDHKASISQSGCQIPIVLLDLGAAGHSACI